jgi:hypothetical protein
MKKISLLLCANLTAMLALGQTDSARSGNFAPPSQPPIVYAAETQGPISVDGRLNEPAWQTAQPITDFFRQEPRQGGRYLYHTDVRILFDKRHLYFGVFCKDSVGKKGVRVQDLRRDFEYGENDIFFIQLDPQNLRRYCMSFQTTPYGNQRDKQVFDDSFHDQDWDALWRVRTHMTDSGYYAEFAIPFKSLRYTQGADSLGWGLTMARLARRDFEQTVFPAIPQSFSPYRMTYAARLKGLQTPPPSANVRVQPYMLHEYNTSTNAQGSSTSSNNLKAGGEVKWAVNPQAVLDFTFNTDFAQADVDRAVNNLTRFNVFFPERRQFFLENSGVYAGADDENIKPFFSRSIGLSNTQFNAEPVPIDAGLRYTDRSQGRTLAALYVHQRATSQQGAANFGVMRYLKNFGKQNNVGVMLTHRLDEARPERGYLQRNNTTLTIDGLIRPKDQLTISYMLSAARNNSADSIGLAGNVFIGCEKNEFYLGNQSKFVTSKYTPGMGFVFQNNVVFHNPGGYYIWRPKRWLGQWIRRWDPGAFLELYHNVNDGKFQSASVKIFPVYISFNSGARLNYTITPTWEHFFFQPIGISVAPGSYSYTRQEIVYQTDQSKKASAKAAYNFGRYYNGRLRTLDLGLRLVPMPHIAFTAEYQRNAIRDLGINKTSTNIDLLTFGTRLAVNPRIQLSGFYQYNSFDKRTRWNVRGSWEFAPLSFLFVVFNENSFANLPVRTQSVISKLTYLKQF